jgi:uncharacterized protein YjeT (DUF2065 family)
MSHSLWVAFAFALVLVLEGLLPLAAPRMWRDMFRRVLAMADGQIRFIGCASIGAGLILLLIVNHA